MQGMTKAVKAGLDRANHLNNTIDRKSTKDDFIKNAVNGIKLRKTRTTHSCLNKGGK